MITYILVIVCWMLAALCMVIANVLAFKFKKSIFKNLNADWWDPKKAHKNKFKNGIYNQGPKFSGSTSVFKFWTNARHLFEALSNSFLALSVVFLISRDFDMNWWQELITFVAIKGAWLVIWSPAYKATLKKRL